MDVLQTEDGREFILELNSSAIGFCARHQVFSNIKYIETI